MLVDCQRFSCAMFLAVGELSCVVVVGLLSLLDVCCVLFCLLVVVVLSLFMCSLFL